MSKTRGKPEPSASKAEPSPAKESLWNSPAAGWAVAVAAGIGLLVHLAAFFRQEIAAGAGRSRLTLFYFLAAPDAMAAEWVEGSWLNFALFDRWPILLCALGLMVYVGFANGVSFVQWEFSLTRLERVVYSQGVGLHLLSLLILLFGLFFGFRGPFILLLFFPGVVVFLVTLGWFNRELKYESDSVLLGDPKHLRQSYLASAAHWSLGIVIGLAALAILFGGMLPPWDFDVREYHLQVPKEWVLEGKATFLPHNVYGNMPLDAEMPAILATPIFKTELRSPERSAWWGCLTGKTMMAAYGPLTALALYCALRRYVSRLAGLAAAATYLSSPWTVHVCVNGLNEGALAFYSFMAVVAALPGRDGRRLTGLSGFLAGAAASCKYPAILLTVFPLAVYLLVADANFWVKGAAAIRNLAWRRAAWFLAIALLSCGLWYGKNLLLTGNPVYPLLGNVLGGTTRTPEKTEQWNKAHRPPPYTFKQLGVSLANVGWKDQFQSPLLVPLTAFGVVALGSAARSSRTASRNPPSEICNLKSAISHHVLTVTALLLLFFLAAWWLFTHRLERFLVPAIPLAALLAGAGVEYAKDKPLKYVVAGLMVIGLTYNLLMAASPLVGDNRWFVSLERLRTDEPTMEGDISRVRPAIRWLNEHAGPEEAVLCVGEAAVFDLERPVFYNTCFDDCLLVNWMENRTAAQRKEEFRSRNIGYVYYDAKEIERYRSGSNYGYDPRFNEELFDELVRQGVLVSPLPNAPPKIYPVAP